MRRLAALALLAAAFPLAGCIPLPAPVRVALNANAVDVAHGNLTNGLPHATAWCYSEGPFLDDTYMVTAVDSSDLLRYGSCRNLWMRGTGATTCNFEARFCTIHAEPPPATTTVTWVDYAPVDPPGLLP